MMQEDVGEFELNDSWLPQLARLTGVQDGVSRACKLLAEKGILCIVEGHLPRSYLDGAVMLYNTDRPVIGLTLRHDRLDNFWFVLFHELGHIFLHLFSDKSYDFFDECDVPIESDIESEADEFALRNLISESQWDRCMSRFALSEESVRIDAANLDIHPSIIAGRIRKEQNNFEILSTLVGQGEVRVQFKEAKNVPK